MSTNRVTTNYARHIETVKRDQVKVANWLGVIVAALLNVALIVNLMVRY